LSENKHLTVCFDVHETANPMPPLFGKYTHIHPTDFNLTNGRETTTVYTGAGLNLHAPADSAFQLHCYSGCDIAFKV
jgi:hypothetical protein